MCVGCLFVGRYVALADVAFSIQFLKWDDIQTTVVVKSQDQQRLPVYTTDFLVHGRKLGIVASDAYRNLQILACVLLVLSFFVVCSGWVGVISGILHHRLLIPSNDI